MKMKHILPATGMSLLFTLAGCGGGGGGSSTPPDTQEVDIKGVPSSLNASACIDSDGDYVCDTQEVHTKKLAVPSDVGDSALILVKISPPEDVAASAYQAYEGKRLMAIPANEFTASPLDTLAYGLYLLAQENQQQKSQSADVKFKPLGEPKVSGIRIYFGANPIHSHSEAVQVLKSQFSLDGSGKQNAAILQAINMNLERLGEQGLELDEAFPANIKAMAESLVNLTIQSQGSPDDDTYPPINLSSIEPLPEAATNPADCVRYEYGNCVEWVGPMPSKAIYSDLLQFDKNNAAQIAYAVRKESDKPTALDNAVAALQCGDTEIKNLYLFGLNDNFDTNNSEPANPQGQAAAYASQLQNIGFTVSDYDYNATQNDQAALIETLSGLPASINSGSVIIGLKENAYYLSDAPIYNSAVLFGSAQNNFWFGALGQNILTTWTDYGHDVYANPLSANLTQGNSFNLLTHIQSGQQTDVLAGNLLNVDFIAIASCEDAPEPTGTPVTEVLKEIKDGFECKTDEQYMEVVGGDFDDFTGGADPHTAGTYLSSFAQIEYDTAIEKQNTFADSLNIAFPNHTVTHAKFAINTRPSAAGAVNDIIAFGDFTTGSPTSSPFSSSTQPTGGASTLNNGTLKIVNESQVFFDVPNLAPAGDMLAMLNSGATAFDVVVGEQTEVDGTLLMLCLSENCVDTDGDGYCDEEEKEVGSDPSNPDSTPDDLDGDGYPNNIDCDPTDPELNIDCTPDIVYPESCNTEVTLSLHEANNWVFEGTSTHPNTGNEFETYPPNPAWAGVIWDGDMDGDGIDFGSNDTWFNFGSAPNTTHVLQNNFCACGDVNVTVNDMKSDNKGYIDIINPDPQNGFMNRLVSRSAGHSQVTMASWGPIESGSWSATGNGSAVDYTLEFGVTNYGGPSGGAVQGTLVFTGHLGMCTNADVVDGDVDDTWPRPLVVDGIAASVGAIAFVENNQGGSVVFDVVESTATIESVAQIRPQPIVIEVSAASSEVIPPSAGLSPLLECVDGTLTAVWLDSVNDEYYSSDIGIACELSAWPPTAF